MDLVSVSLSPFSLLEESPYEGVYNIGLVLLQPVAGPRDNIETEMIPNVQTASLCHFLLQECIPLSPQQQHWRPDVVVVQGERAVNRDKRGKKKKIRYCVRTFFRREIHHLSTKKLSQNE